MMNFNFTFWFFYQKLIKFKLDLIQEKCRVSLKAKERTACVHVRVFVKRCMPVWLNLDQNKTHRNLHWSFLFVTEMYHYEKKVPVCVSSHFAFWSLDSSFSVFSDSSGAAWICQCLPVYLLHEAAFFERSWQPDSSRMPLKFLEKSMTK